MLVRLDCPWCGSEVELDADTDASARCAECSVVLELAEDEPVALPQAA